MKHNFILVLLTLLLAWRLPAQAQELCNFGARAAGMAYATATLHDVWALSNNTAGIAALEQPSFGVQASTRYGERAFTTVALQAIYPTQKYGTYGLSMSRFGDALFSQQHAGLGVAHKLGNFSLGAKADVWQVSVQEYGSRKAVALSVGVQGEVLPDLYFGAFAYNLNQARLASLEDERLPTVMKAGLSYRPTSRLLIAAETEKSIDYDADFKAGAEYALLQRKFILRSGFSALSGSLSVGAGFRARQLQVDYAYGSTAPIGSSHHLSLAYTLQSRTPVTFP
ncbi:PorV/PorQ family protein [Pontibacter mangrovi]|uniref:Type IX secretion system membrane protein PorP/SprF n=1 Tax=Pontibacter mangrovi TaxID=2589816 RepID=A0A501W5Z5_9BACT|nr:hypothetical protein [Pontibacter mangrovi]TPE43720.1 hypothetical protein FJM65_13330 [Pontibacter mangrovi]